MINQKLAGQMLEYITASSALEDRLQQELAGHRAQQKAAAEKRAAVCDALIAQKAVQPHEKAAALQLLSSHSHTLDLLVNAANKTAEFEKKAAAAMQKTASMDLGRASDQPSGSASASAHSSLTGPFVGARSSTKKASDLALASVLGPPTPRR